MYDYHYGTMKSHFGDKINLMYTDTGKLLFLFTFCYYKHYNRLFMFMVMFIFYV